MTTDAATPSLPEAIAPAGGRRDLSTTALIIGIIGLLIAGAGLIYGLVSANPRPIESWLMGFTFWFSVSIGTLMLIQMFYVFDAGWATVIRRQMEHMLAGMPIVCAAFVPVLLVCLFSSEVTLWKWLHPSTITYPGTTELVKDDVLYQHKAGYLNVTFFIVRIIGYFAVLNFLAWRLRTWSFQMDTAPDAKTYVKCRALSAAGIVLTALALTFAAFDFYMSIAYHWFSTMYGVWFFAVSVRLGLAATIILCFYLGHKGHLRGLYKPAHEYYLGCLCLAFTIFWAYISFSQYFLIYNANIPEETFWYNIRELTETWDTSPWYWFSLGALVVGFFIVPFFYLLWFKNKFKERLLFIGYWIAAFAVTDFYFNIIPGKKNVPEASEKYPLGYKLDALFDASILFDIAAIVGIGGLFVWALLRSMNKTEVIPIHDPRIDESVNASL
ncbi:MAG: hypothetical protein ACFBZ8_01830 [Opitutales bacterium]